MFRTDLSHANSLVQLVGRARRVTPWFIAPFVAILIFGGLAQFTDPLGFEPSPGMAGAKLWGGLVQFLTPIASQPIGTWLKGISDRSYAVWMSPFFMLVGFGIAWLLLYLWVRLVEWRPFHTIGLGLSRSGLMVLFGIVLALLMTSLVMVGLMIGGQLQPRVAAPGTTGGVALAGILFMLLAFAVQSSSEEALYRGFLMNVVSYRVGLAAGIGVSTLLFALAHSRNHGFDALAAINLVLFALFVALLAVRTGSIWASCAWHTLWNWSIANVWGLEISGEPPDGGSIMAWQSHGLKLWTGGDWGPEGGLAATIVLALGVAALFLWRGLGEPVAKEAHA
ncbi:MAG: lysostaphin resistance A-like protein [Reyranellaceae bacterium]